MCISLVWSLNSFKTYPTSLTGLLTTATSSDFEILGVISLIEEKALYASNKIWQDCIWIWLILVLVLVSIMFNIG